MSSIICRIFKVMCLCVSVLLALILVLIYYHGHDLPNHAFLKVYTPPEGTRMYSRDNVLYREMSSEYRVFVPIHEIPPLLIKAFLVAEDKNFYYHPGIDLLSIIRAVIDNTIHRSWHVNPIGASTITQQVAKNFLVGNERSYIRKIREAIMSIRIESALSKDRILELYFNQIYFGMRSYGIASAAYAYFQKSLNELSLAECAFLASLPKAPSNYHPVQEKDKALVRRNWTLKRLAEEGVISYAEMQKAQNEPLLVNLPVRHNINDYPSENVRRELAQRYGVTEILNSGFSVYTSLDTHLQKKCEEALREGLETYDKRHGFRGPVVRMNSSEIKTWRLSLKSTVDALKFIPKNRKNDLAVVLTVASNQLELGFLDGRKGFISTEDFIASRFLKNNGKSGKGKTQLSSFFQIGDVIFTRIVDNLTDKGDATIHTKYTVDQIPTITGAMVVVDAETGEILAMTGGYSTDISQFNCATQAMRQPGSSFKPFVYLAALESGYTKDTIIDDAPIEINMGQGLGVYAPKNATGKSFGPLPLYQGLERSSNQMTVRIAHQIGMFPIQNVAKRLGCMGEMPSQLAMSLGAGETTLLKITGAYAPFVNGGKRLYPHLITRVHDRLGRMIFQMPPAFDDHLFNVKAMQSLSASDYYMMTLGHVFVQDDRSQVVDPAYATEMKKMLRGVVMRGTARQISYLKEKYGFDIGGKTGTTNDYKDAWFIGFIKIPAGKTLLIGTFVGHPLAKSLGKGEGGGRVALPIFESFILKINNIKASHKINFSIYED
ncbi:MAG: PBP1A family penicillin-binding protein [Candidatus Paracaedibacteraceae bacterium]|nr:PBP1A family penicillin-binding protein [Candidatus Paracaedibacteraceae bacterium]